MIGQLLASALAATAITFRKELFGKKYETIVYDQKLSDIFDLVEEAERYLDIGKLRKAATLIDQQLKIDSEHPTPYALLGRYYQLHASDLKGNNKRIIIDKSLDSYNNALELAKLFTPLKVLPVFRQKVNNQIGLVLGVRSRCKFDAGDIAGAIVDLKASLEYDLPNDVKRASKEVLDSLQSLG